MAFRNYPDQNMEDERLELLNELSPNSRQNVYQDLHGNHLGVPAEEPSFIQRRIHQVDDVLASMENAEKESFHLACRRSPSLSSDHSLRLRFLRAESFDPGLAAHRITQYYDFIRKWFGDDMLGKNISLSDLNEFDRESLASGGYQIPPQKDLSGRTILFMRKSECKYKSMEHMVSQMLSSSISLNGSSHSSSLYYIYCTLDACHILHGGYCFQGCRGPEKRSDRGSALYRRRTTSL
jgi:hypothetical protein